MNQSEKKVSKPRSYLCIFLSYALQFFLSCSAMISYFLHTSDFKEAQGQANTLRLQNLFCIIIDIAIILTLTTTSATYGSSHRESKQTYFWIIVGEILIRGLLSYFTLTAMEYDVVDLIEDFKNNSSNIPKVLIFCHFKRQAEKIVSIVVSAVGVLLAKIVLDSECHKQDHAHQHKQA